MPAVLRASTLVKQLCRSCVSDAGVDGAGVSVLSRGGTPLVLHSTSPVAATIEELQFTLGEGPCMDASSSGRPVLVADLEDRSDDVAQRWPVFRAEAEKAGVRAVFAFPVRIGAISLGVMDLYRTRPGPMSAGQVSTTFAAVDALGHQILDLEDTPPVEALTSYPLTVHQAAGMVMVQADITIEDALVRLRATAYRDGRSVGELAADVVAGRYRFGREPS